MSQWVAVNKAARDVKDTAEQVTPVTAVVPDATENLNIEFKRVKESEEQFLGVRDVLEQLTQKVAIARDERRLAEEAVLTPESRGRELPEKPLQEQATLEWNVESDWNGGSDWINLHTRDESWSRRSSRRNDAGLAYGHEQIQRVESADAAQRGGAVEHPRSEERKECASGRLAYAQCAQVGETERVSQQKYPTSTGHGPRLV